MAYTNQKIAPDTYKIIDDFGDCMYLVVGKDGQAVIDAGMDRENLREHIRKISDLETILLLSHGHVDHIGQSADFERVFLSPLDRELYRSFELMPPEPGQFSTQHLSIKENEALEDLKTEQVFDLGDRVLIALPCYGHTPGSFIFLQPDRQIVYTGDAIGSGCGVWLWDENSYPVSQYKTSLQDTLKLLEKYGVDESWKFYGGHHDQEYMSHTGPYNRLDIHLMEDMVELCDELLNGNPNKEAVDASGLPHAKKGLKPYHAWHKKAEMLTADEKVK